MSTSNTATDTDSTVRETCDRCGYPGGIRTHSVDTPADRLCFGCAFDLGDGRDPERWDR